MQAHTYPKTVRKLFSLSLSQLSLVSLSPTKKLLSPRALSLPPVPPLALLTPRNMLLRSARSLGTARLVASRGSQGAIKTKYASVARRCYHRTAARATTIVAVRKDGEVAVIGDGQVSLGPTIMKPNAQKVRRLGADGDIVAGFAGSTADALALMERLEGKLEQYPGQLARACVELTKLWRTDKYLRRLDAVLLVANEEQTFELTGNGDVIEPQDGVIAIGSGGAYALAAARALVGAETGMTAKEIAERSLSIAADICVYTNHETVVECIPKESEESEGDD